MADGSQLGFNIPRHMPATRLRPGEIVVDLFAGGGGASVALEQALQRAVDIAINHDEFAVGMHAANHPLTRHMREDVWVADPREIAAGRIVGWLHASPDCTHFSQARGGQPRSRKTRSLSWVVVKWAGRLHKAGLGPRYISLENVEQILTWGPLVAKRDKATGRVLKMDGSVAERGERVPVGNQQLVPDKKRAGQTWDRFVAILRGFGYAVEWKKVIAADHGAGTSRKRLFLVARCDGRPIIWPQPTHGPGRALPYVTAADCIDWTIAGKSIFGRKKDLADATMRRIARGIKRYVLDAAEPFIVYEVDLTNCANRTIPVLTEHANASREAAWKADEPLRTQCANVKGGHFALASAVLAGVGGRAGDSEPRTVAAPGYTTTGKADCAVVTAFLEQANGGGPNGNPAPARAATDPVSTITSAGSQQRLVACELEQYDAANGHHPGSDRIRTLRGPGGRHDLAAEATGSIGARLADHTPSGRDPHAERLPRAEDGCGPQAALGVRAQAGVDGAEGTDSGRAADQPHRRGQDEQHPSESGSRYSLGQHPARLRHGAEGAPTQHPRAETAPGGGCREGAAERGSFVLGDCEAPADFADASVQSRALRVAAFLCTYYGNGDAVSLKDPLDTITTRDRLALVTVHVRGVPYVIVDITLRMLTPPELYRAQGFPGDYIIDRTADGRKLTVSQQVRMVGNSVSPPPLFAIVDANLDEVEEPMRLAA